MLLYGKDYCVLGVEMLLSIVNRAPSRECLDDSTWMDHLLENH